jgi:hypothetical protein
MRAKCPNVYMYMRRRIYKEPLEKYNNRKANTYLIHVLFKNQERLPFHGSFLVQGTQRYPDAKGPNKQQMHLKGICKQFYNHVNRVWSSLLMSLTFSLASTLVNIAGSIIKNM